MHNNLEYDANESNINRMIQVQRQKINHLKTLNTIYKKKSLTFRKQQEQLHKQRQLRINNQIIDKQRKLKEQKSLINRQNNILRNKLIKIYLHKNLQRTKSKDYMFSRQQKTHRTIVDEVKPQNSFTILKDLRQQKRFGLNFRSVLNNHEIYSPLNASSSNSNVFNPRKIQLKKELQQTNAKFFIKLSNIKSQLMPKLKLKQHNQQANYFKEMITKKSPVKQQRFKKIVGKNITERSRIGQLFQTSYRQRTDNPQNQMIFY